MGNKTTRKVRIESYVTPEEAVGLKAFAGRLGLSVSETVRRVMTNTKLPDSERNKDVLALMKINGDLARAGNLFKLAIDEGTCTPAELAKPIDAMMATQQVLREKIGQLRS